MDTEKDLRQLTKNLGMFNNQKTCPKLSEIWVESGFQKQFVQDTIVKKHWIQNQDPQYRFPVRNDVEVCSFNNISSYVGHFFAYVAQL
jgi:hypothetical protein